MKLDDSNVLIFHEANYDKRILRKNSKRLIFEVIISDYNIVEQIIAAFAEIPSI